MEGKILVMSTVVSDGKDEENAFLKNCSYSSVLDEDIDAMHECYLNLPGIPDPAENPLGYACVHKQQHQDRQLLALQAKYPEQYAYKSFGKDLDGIICYVHPGDNPGK
jgi:hypothetical protein